jgi:hypothetical protein
MTPCEKLGYKVGDKFEVLWLQVDEAFSVGSIIELYKDVGGETPLFKLIKGSCDYVQCNGEAGAYLSLDLVKPLKETTYPTEPFKVSLVDLTQDQKAVVLKWLEEVAKSNSWDYGYLYEPDYEINYVWHVNDLRGGDVEGFIVATEDGKYNQVELPELTLSFSTSITGFNLPDKKSKQVLQMEELIDKLTTQLEEATKALEEIKKK